MLRDITADVENYRQCLKSVWADFAGRFDTDQDWDLCDLFADIGCRIFDSYIAGKYGIPKGKKAKQYQNQYQQSPIKEIMVIPCRGARGCRCRLNSASQVIWENYVHNSGSDFSIGWMFMIMIFPPPTDRSNIFYRKINADSILFSTMRMSAFFWTKRPESEEELDIGPDRNHGEAIYCCEESSSRS